MATQTRARTTKIMPAEPVDVDYLEQEKHALAVNNNNDVDGDDYEKTDEDIINDVLSELGGTSDAKVNVYLNESGKAPAFVGSYSPDTFSIDAIQMAYGAGDYSIHVRSGGRIRSRKTLRIAKPRVDTVLPSNNNERLIETMQQGFTRLFESMQSMSQNRAPEKSTSDILQEMVLMKQIVGGNDGAKQGLQMQDFLTMLEVAKGLVPASGETGTNDLLMEGLRSLAPILAQGAANQRVPQQMQRANIPLVTNPLPAENVAQNDTNVLQSETLTDNPLYVESEAMKFQEKMLFNLLLKNAENDNDPAPYAQMLLDLVGSDEAEKLLNTGDWFKNLVERDSRCQNYEAWFTELRANMLDIVQEEKQLLESDAEKPLTTEQKLDIKGENTQTENSKPDANTLSAT